MAIIGATELQPVNVVSNYLAGRESRQNQLAKQQEMAMRQQQMAMQQRAAQRAEEAAAAESQNALLRRQALATRDPNAMFGDGFTEEAKNYVLLVRNQEENARKRHEFNVGNMASEAGALANDPSALNKATLTAWVQSYVDKGVITPEAAQRFAAVPDDPQQLSQAMMRVSRQGLTAQQQGEMERAAQTAAREERRLALEGQRVGLDRQRLGLEGRRVAVSEREATQPAAGDKPPVGYRFSATGDLEAIPGGPSDPAVIKRNMEAGRAAPVGSARTSEQERNTAYNTGRLLGSLASITRATTSDASAGAPNVVEAALLSSPFGILEPAANFARGPQRQIVANAQADLIDALLYLATGAAYNKEQLQAQRQSYLPNFTDKTAARDDKRARLKELIVAAKIRSGNAWTPELEERFRTYVGDLAAPSAAPSAAPTGVLRQTASGTTYTVED